MKSVEGILYDCVENASCTESRLGMTTVETETMCYVRKNWDLRR